MERKKVVIFWLRANLYSNIELSVQILIENFQTGKYRGRHIRLWVSNGGLAVKECLGMPFRILILPKTYFRTMKISLFSYSFDDRLTSNPIFKFKDFGFHLNIMKTNKLSIIEPIDLNNARKSKTKSVAKCCRYRSRIRYVVM